MSWAHVSTYEVPPGDNAVVEQFNEALGDVKGPGFERAEVLHDSSSGKAITITVWESEEALQASVVASGGLRGDHAYAAGITHSTFRIYEVARTED